jgi:hypothetical protein
VEAKTKTKPTPPKKYKAKTARAKTSMTEMDNYGRHYYGDSFYDHFGDLCKYKAVHGTTKVPRTNARKNECVRKRKACDQLAPHVVTALNGINFQWTAGQSLRGKFEIRFAKLEESKKTHGTVSFLGEDKKNFPKLASLIFYAKSTSIKVIM